MPYFAERFSLAIDWTSLARAEADLEAAHALMDSAAAEERGMRPRLPQPDAR